MTEVTRRRFVVESFVAPAALAAATAFGKEAKSVADRLTVAVIGPGGMGTNHLQLLAARNDVRVAYLCDPDSERLKAAAKVLTSAGRDTPKAVKDLREVLDDKNVDAVWIATPDHWHAPAGILACNAGKHVYVEKPCSHNVREGRLLLEAARRNNRVVQTGHQSRSTPHVQRAMQLLKEGIIGEVLVAKAWNSQLRGNIGHVKTQEPPAHLDWDLWLGPAPERKYQANLHPSRWRFFYAFGAGDIGNDGVHDLDIARWGLGVATQPTTVTGLGSKYFFDDDQEFPDNEYCLYEWPGDGQVRHKRQLVFEQRDWSPYVQEGYENGNAFYGTKGMMLLGKNGGFQVQGVRNAPGEKATGSTNLPAHHQNFVECIRSGKRPNGDIEEGHYSASLAHLGNIACRVGRLITLDPQKETVANDPEATALLSRSYRDGHWAVPKGV
jgi:predicted dehydrogenase